jgi:hypothetical protein
MKRAYVSKDFKPETLEVINRANTILTQYQEQGYVMTLRQLYYQFVSRNWLVNTERSYKRLASIVSDGRLAGLLDWDGIEDRGRVVQMPPEWSSLASLVNAAMRGFRLPRWEGQENYVELWVEKQALAGVLEPLAEEFHVALMVNKGYSSQSAMHDSAARFRQHQSEKECFLLYLGDHDPSGEDMVRDIRDRLSTFRAKVCVEKLALTMEQVEEYDPPPNPAKMSDSRAANYVDQHGDSSWEVDALPPNVLGEIIRGRLEELIDQDLVDAIIEKENTDKEWLRNVVEQREEEEENDDE